MKYVYILIGVPGSGKSTFTDQFPNPDKVICSADHFFSKSGTYLFEGGKLPQAHAECMAKFKKALSDQASLIFVDNTNILPQHRAPYEDLAKEFGYEVAHRVFDVDPKLAHARNVHGVPLASIQRMHNVLLEQGLVN